MQNPANGFPARPLGDKGYDSLKNILHVISLGMIPVIAIRLPKKDPETGQRLYEGIYVKDGRPTCLGGKPMKYVRDRPRAGPPFSGALPMDVISRARSTSRGIATTSTTSSRRANCCG